MTSHTCTHPNGLTCPDCGSVIHLTDASFVSAIAAQVTDASLVSALAAEVPRPCEHGLIGPHPVYWREIRMWPGGTGQVKEWGDIRRKECPGGYRQDDDE